MAAAPVRCSVGSGTETLNPREYDSFYLGNSLRRIEPAQEQILRKNSFEVFLRMTGCGVSFP
jgi:hypothetical protein